MNPDRLSFAKCYGSILDCRNGMTDFNARCLAWAVLSGAMVGGISVALRTFWKQARHRTGLPCLGLNGTVVSAPHSAHFTCVSGRGARREPSLPLHLLQRFGSFVNCFSLKKACSPELNTNSAPHSTHFRNRSENSMTGPLFLGASRLFMPMTSRVSSLTREEVD